jgi:putative FmdB family regulatory protein
MPVYEYVCPKGLDRFEVLASIAKKEQGLDPECPKCGSTGARQVFSSVAISTGGKNQSSPCCPGRLEKKL